MTKSRSNNKRPPTFYTFKILVNLFWEGGGWLVDTSKTISPLGSRLLCSFLYSANHSTFSLLMMVLKNYHFYILNEPIKSKSKLEYDWSKTRQSGPIIFQVRLSIGTLIPDPMCVVCSFESYIKTFCRRNRLYVLAPLTSVNNIKKRQL